MDHEVPLDDRFELAVSKADAGFWDALAGEQHWTFHLGGEAPSYRDAFSHVVVLRPLGLAANYRRIHVLRPAMDGLRQRLGDTPEQDGYRWEAGSVFEREGAPFRTSVFLLATADDAVQVVAALVAALDRRDTPPRVADEQDYEAVLRALQAGDRLPE